MYIKCMFFVIIINPKSCIRSKRNRWRHPIGLSCLTKQDSTMQCINDGSGETGTVIFLCNVHWVDFQHSLLLSLLPPPHSTIPHNRQPTPQWKHLSSSFPMAVNGCSKKRLLTSDSLCHLGPNLLEDKEKPGEFYNWFGRYLKQLKPSAIVVISAHWQGQGKNGIFGKCHLMRGGILMHDWLIQFDSGHIWKARVDLRLLQLSSTLLWANLGSSRFSSCCWKSHWIIKAGMSLHFTLEI